MEPVYCHLAIREMGFDSGDEGTGHVRDHLNNIPGVAAMLRKELFESGQRLFALAGCGKHHWLLMTIKIYEDRDVSMATPGLGFVQREGL